MNETVDSPDDLPPFPVPPDPLALSALKPHEAANAVELRLDDITGAMRDALIHDNYTDFELMLASQATIMNAAFNRLMGAALGRDALKPETIEPALRAQRNVCSTLNTLRRLRTVRQGN